MSAPMTLRQAVQAREDEHWDKFGRRWAAEDAERRRIADVLTANPQIGVLVSEKGTRYYVWPAGGEYREADDPAKLA